MCVCVCVYVCVCVCVCVCVQGEYDVFAHVHPATGFDMEKVRTTLKQFYRDWSRQVNTDFAPHTTSHNCSRLCV